MISRRSGGGLAALAIALAASVLVPALVACSSEIAGTPPSTSGIKNTEFALDNYRGLDMEVVEYALQIQSDKCMADAGYPQNLQVDSSRPYPTTSVFVTDESQFGLLSEDQARAKGFGQDPGWQPPKVASFDKNYDEVAEKCRGAGWRALGSGSEDLFRSYHDLGNELLLYREEVDRRLPEDLPAKMLTCIKRKGYQPADEQQFLQTPKPQLLGIEFGQVEGGSEEWTPNPEPGTVQVDRAFSPGKYVPTPEEAKLAVAWYQCQQETGTTKANRETIAAVQREFVEKRAEALTELNPKIEALAKTAAQLVGKA
ncbi:hypothetical protein AB0B20_22615 [Micromonospora sp. NPDC049151]|uniref:hypothetical protein n=1 Tax=Micromonospora sp. NPDC049151 TaxID=3155648 RepID=UPI003406BEB8